MHRKSDKFKVVSGRLLTQIEHNTGIKDSEFEDNVNKNNKDWHIVGQPFETVHGGAKYYHQVMEKNKLPIWNILNTVIALIAVLIAIIGL